jgi:hypothetical protein
MFASFKFAGGKGIRYASAAIAFSAMLLTGCAGASVTNANQYSALPTVHPDNIYVYTFGGSADDVKLDNSGLVHKLTTGFSGSSSATQQAQESIEAREQVTNEVVAKLQSMGLRAIRSDVPPPADQNVLIIEGNLDSIDAGNHRRRMLIGLGAGKSEVSAQVQVLYKPAGGQAQLVESFDTKADSGKAPGVAETAGVGAAVGHVATSAAMGGGFHAVSDKKHDTVSADAKRLADSVAKQVAQIGVDEGWLSTSSVK